jgi:hypothetical protein
MTYWQIQQAAALAWQRVLSAMGALQAAYDALQDCQRGTVERCEAWDDLRMAARELRKTHARYARLRIR